MFLINDLKQSGISIDKFTQFPLIPHELRSNIEMIGNYHRWFYIIVDKKFNSYQMDFNDKWNDEKCMKWTNVLVQSLGVWLLFSSGWEYTTKFTFVLDLIMEVEQQDNRHAAPELLNLRQ